MSIYQWGVMYAKFVMIISILISVYKASYVDHCRVIKSLQQYYDCGKNSNLVSVVQKKNNYINIYLSNRVDNERTLHNLCISIA